MNKLKGLAALAVVGLLSACMQPGMGPGRGPGPGPGPMGPGMGPGMGGMGGMGPGMGGMGPGMMADGCGPFGDGWGMGMGMGPGAGSGRGPMAGACGPGMAAGLDRLDLTAEQRSRIAQIQQEVSARQRDLMRAMQAQGGPPQGMPDEQAERRHYEAMSAMHKQMFESRLEARKRILDVLTPQQREQLGRGGQAR